MSFNAQACKSRYLVFEVLLSTCAILRGVCSSEMVGLAFVKALGLCLPPDLIPFCMHVYMLCTNARRSLPSGGTACTKSPEPLAPSLVLHLQNGNSMFNYMHSLFARLWHSAATLPNTIQSRSNPPPGRSND